MEFLLANQDNIDEMAHNLSPNDIDFLVSLLDEKFITSRQTIQSINSWILLKPQFFSLINN